MCKEDEDINTDEEIAELFDEEKEVNTYLPRIAFKDVREVMINDPLDLDGVNMISLHFIDGKFERAEIPYTAFYSKNEWKVLAQMSDRIEEIEEAIKGEHELSIDPIRKENT